MSALSDWVADVLRAYGLPPEALEHRFDQSRRWRFDLAWPWARVAVEVHGAEYAQGRHTRGSGFRRDREKMNAAQLQGWIVLEYTGTDARQDPHRIRDEVTQALKLRERGLLAYVASNEPSHAQLHETAQAIAQDLARLGYIKRAGTKPDKWLITDAGRAAAGIPNADR